MSVRSTLSFLPATIGAVLLAGSGSPALAQNISELAVSGRAPTQIAISLAGKSATTVRDEVRVAARTVCRNAVHNRELGFDDAQWCRHTSGAKALRRYEAIVAGAQRSAGALPTIILSSR
jgi:hypothetical protein